MRSNRICCICGFRATSNPPAPFGPRSGFVVDTGGRLELFDAKWTELPDAGDTVNLGFVRNAVGKSRVTGGAVVARTANAFPFSNGFRALPVTDLE